MKTKILILLLTALLIPAFTGCNKDKETSTGEVKQPDIAKNGTLIPAPEGLKNSNDPFAQQILTLFNSFNMAGSYIKYFTPPSGSTPFNASVAGAAAYTWNDGETTYWLVYYETGNKLIWKLDADSGSGRKQFASIEESKDEKSGTFELNVSDMTYHGEWSYDNDNNFSIEITFHSSEGDIRITATENADGSGNLHYYVNGNEIITAQWNADGSGSYTIHSENGTYTGQWSSGK